MANFREMAKSQPKPNVRPIPPPLLVSTPAVPGTVNCPAARPTPPLKKKPRRLGNQRTTTVAVAVSAVVVVSPREKPNARSSDEHTSTPSGTRPDTVPPRQTQLL